MMGQKAKNPMRVGSLERDKPSLLRKKTLKWILFVRFRPRR